MKRQDEEIISNTKVQYSLLHIHSCNAWAGKESLHQRDDRKEEQKDLQTVLFLVLWNTYRLYDHQLKVLV